MDTIYYTLDTRRVKVSGGADLLTVVSTPASAPAAAGQVLDFDRCRRKLETRAAWKDLAQAAEEAGRTAMAERWDAPAEDGAGTEDDRIAVSAPRTRMDRATLWMELAASAAVILMSLCGGMAFLSLV